MGFPFGRILKLWVLVDLRLGQKQPDFKKFWGRTFWHESCRKPNQKWGESCWFVQQPWHPWQPSECAWQLGSGASRDPKAKGQNESGEAWIESQGEVQGKGKGKGESEGNGESDGEGQGKTKGEGNESTKEYQRKGCGEEQGGKDNTQV